MTPTYTKVDANTLQVSTQTVPVTDTISYTYDQLTGMVAALQAQKDAYNSNMDAQITAAQALVTEADSLGIVSSQTITSN